MKILFQALFLFVLFLPNFGQAKIIEDTHLVVYDYEAVVGHQIEVDENCRKVMYRLWYMDVYGKIIGPDHRYVIEPKNSLTTCQHLVTLK